MSQEKSFIEVQFPVSKISKEAYKERKAGAGQTLTGLGKWWGRKPLILVRSALLGLLMPASDDPQKDREIFEAILMLDREGLETRKNKAIAVDLIYSVASPSEKNQYFENNQTKPVWKAGISNTDKQKIQERAFARLSYDNKLKHCKRPEEMEKLPNASIKAINEHLGIKAASTQEIFQELGKKSFGEIPWVGDCFCGGGSVPFESARVGLNAFASDLNPIAMLLTWASLNLFSVSEKEAQALEQFQQEVFDEADRIISEWGIEHNEHGMRANSYLYCTETHCPECGWKVPMAPSWVIGTKTKTVAILHPNDRQGFDIEIKSNASASEMKKAEKGTVMQFSLICHNPSCGKVTPIPLIRKDKPTALPIDEYRYNTPNALRKWGRVDYVSENSDIFKDRLYCIRFENSNGEKIYSSPTENDLNSEKVVSDKLNRVFNEWQENGFIPARRIEKGWHTNELTFERGWQYWHQLFNPRQLLVHGLLMELVSKKAKTQKEKGLGLISINRCANWNSKLSIWHKDDTHLAEQTFYNQAFNTIFNYATRPLNKLSEMFFTSIKSISSYDKGIIVKPSDARQITHPCHLWITDPPYADAVNYHELSEFFLAWDEKMLPQIFPDWYTDSKRALAVKGTGESFHQSMIQIYQNLARLMPDDGMQIVMFTHQDVSVWADLTLILWSAGLRVTAAWNVATETESAGLKSGNYVKGTVLLVLRKQLSNEIAYLDELYPEIEQEVKRQIDSMQQIDDKEEPNFYDPDYLLAAYAASLKVLTSYKKIEDIDIAKELSRLQSKQSESPIEKIIYQAVKIAYDYLIPPLFDTFSWKMLSPEERFYLKSLDMEKEGVTKLSAYQELARGFGVTDYKAMLASTKANEARLKTAFEMGMKGIGSDQTFSRSLLRQVFASLHQGIKEEDPVKGKNWLRNEIPSYWSYRNQIQILLGYLISLSSHAAMKHWHQDAEMARYILELVKNDTL